MSLISKLCVLFLGWTIVGIGLNYATLLIYQFRAYMLDPYNNEMHETYSYDSWSEAFASVGGHYEKSDCENRKERRSALEDFVLVAILGILWPMSVAALSRAFGSTYTRFRNEYEQGIRVKQERLS